MSKMMTRLYQCLNYALYNDTEQTCFVLLHSFWCMNSRSEVILNEDVKQNNITTKFDSKINEWNVKFKNVNQRQNLKHNLWDLMNISLNDCIHEIDLRFFDDDMHKKLNYVQS